ncbi:unnamed protein product [Camellia sinensis]
MSLMALRSCTRKFMLPSVQTPTQKKSEKEPPKQHKRYNLKKLTYDERKASLIERLNALNAAAGADEEVDDEDDE